MNTKDPGYGKPLTVSPVGRLADFIKALLEQIKTANRIALEQSHIPPEKVARAKKLAAKLVAHYHAVYEQLIAEEQKTAERDRLAAEQARAEAAAKAAEAEAKARAAEEEAAKVAEQERLAQEKRAAAGGNANAPEIDTNAPLQPITDHPPKTLVAYFSRADENYEVGFVSVGNTEIVAQRIVKRLRELFGNDSAVDEFKIEPRHQYPIKYLDAVELATEEKRTDARPEISNAIDNPAEYEVVFLGYPIWWGDFPMVVRTLLDSYDFSGKILVPFCTHEGSGDADTPEKLKSLIPNAVIANSLSLPGHLARTPDAEPDIDSWLIDLAPQLVS